LNRASRRASTVNARVQLAAVRIDIPTADGTLDLHLFTPPGAGPWPAVLLYMDAFGIRESLHEMARRLASNGYVVGIPNLYYRTGAFAPFDPKAVTVDGPERTRFTGMIRSIDGSKVMRDTAAVLAYLDTRHDVRRGVTGTVGYCMGGGYALLTAGTYPDRIEAAASLHGGSLATDRPDSPHLLADRIRAEVYVGVAEIDHTFDQAQQDRLAAALSAAGVTHEIEVYKGARHGFAVTGHLAYDQPASERHWRRIIDLFGRRLNAAAS
jgi:carboxymethylenebutenolidase